jgi:hypothetical protein
MAFLSQASHLGSWLLPHDAFQEHAAHPAEWSAARSSKDSERTCIRSGLATFLHYACTAHSDYVVDRWASEVKGSSSHDFLFLHGVQSQNLLENNVSNINGLGFYHEIRWNLKKVTQIS